MYQIVDGQLKIRKEWILSSLSQIKTKNLENFFNLGKILKMLLGSSLQNKETYKLVNVIFKNRELIIGWLINGVTQT